MSAGQQSENFNSSVSRWVAAAAVGAVAFLLALIVGDSKRAWAAFLVNLIFWMGLAQGGVVASAAFYLAQGRWGGAVAYRLAEAFSGFILPGFILFWLLFLGRTEIFPWIKHPIPRLAAWLNVPFLFARDGLGLAWMVLVTNWFLRASRSADTLEWINSPGEIELPPKPLRRLAPTVAISYAVVYSIIAFDLIMSLSPPWYSTLFGAYIFESLFWLALAAMAFVAVRMISRVPENSLLASPRFRHDLGKLVFAFSIFWVYLSYAQFLAIWYAHLPQETFFIVPRYRRLPWGILGWSTVFLVWVIPFLSLLGKKPKENPKILGTVALLGMIGIWIELYVLITPSILTEHRGDQIIFPYYIPLGWVEALITLGFYGLFRLCTKDGFVSLIETARAALIEAGELKKEVAG